MRKSIMGLVALASNTREFAKDLSTILIGIFLLFNAQLEHRQKWSTRNLMVC